MSRMKRIVRWIRNLYLALSLLLFAPRLGELVRVWLDDANYSHGFLVPCVSLYFAWVWLRREPWPGRGSRKRRPRESLPSGAPAYAVSCA